VSANPTIYTAILAGYDSLKPQPADAGRFCAYIEAPDAMAPWQTLPAQRLHASTRLDARWHKLHPQLLLADSEVSLCIDGSATLKQGNSVESLAELYLRDADIAFFPHPVRRCLFDEALDTIANRLDDADKVLAQVARYTAAGCPQNAGLFSSGFLLRRHTLAIERFNEQWWHELSTGSLRDQVSLPYVLRTSGIRYRILPGTIYDNPHVSIARHAIPRTRPHRPRAVRLEHFAHRFLALLESRAPRTYRSLHTLTHQLAPAPLTTWLRRLELEEW
jgi:hypothetical protein